MVVADWGMDEDPSDFGAHASEWDPVDSDQQDDVAEVASARRHGFFAAPEAPLWCFLPAIWPRAARAWVRDQRVRHSTRQCEGGPVERVPWTAADYAALESDTNALLAELGVPGRPAGRIWLLRPPAGCATLDDVLNEIWDGWQASGQPSMATGEFVAQVEAALGEIFGEPST